MNLIITPPQKLDINDFIKSYLLNIIPEVYIDIVDRIRLVRFNEYINSLNLSAKTRTGKQRQMNVGEVLYGAFHNLVIENDGNSYIIRINPDITIPNFNIKFITVAELVNFGTVSVAPYPIVDEVFNRVAENMRDYYTQYVLENINSNGN